MHLKIMVTKYHKLDMAQDELLSKSSVIEDAAYVIDADSERMNYSTVQMGNGCKCKSSSSTSPCRASSLEFKFEKE
ncbi:hypothetical protein CO037_02990 [Candidatus Pacearchaeota archaeon CG_4_9_14_0_2_um_filter_30_8]|nr:MAG: hypothetical protein CO037_02990 [Candidatus Pacearchaeota archaeon CG_4_9_14_0_2_um_filter_30_8]